MKVSATIQLILSILLISTMLKAQGEEQLFYQIIDKGKLVKISAKDNKLEFKNLDFAKTEGVFLIAYCSETSAIYMVTNETKSLIKIDFDGRIIDQKRINGLPNTTLVISAIDNHGNMYLGGFHPDLFYKVNVKEDGNTVEQIKFEKRIVGIYDMTYVEQEHCFYSITQNGNLIKINPKNGSVEVNEKVKFEYGLYGSIWHDNENSIYGFNNNTGSIYKYDQTKEQIVDLGKAPYIGNYNDGTAVIKKAEKAKAKNLVSTQEKGKKAKAKTVAHKLEKKAIEYLFVYPNPSNGAFSTLVKTKLKEKGMLKLYTIEGKLIKAKTVNKGDRQVDFNLQHLIAGTYILSLETESGVLESKQLIIE